MDIKKRTEALLLAANRALSVKDIVELLETQSAEEESEVLSAVVSLKEDYADKPYDPQFVPSECIPFFYQAF